MAWRWKSPKCYACHEKCKSSFENDAKVVCLSLPVTLNDFRRVMKHVGMSQSATPAIRNKAQRSKPLKGTTFCSTPHRHGHSDLTNACDRLRTVAGANAASSEHTLNPQTPTVKREPLLLIREILPPERHMWSSGLFPPFRSCTAMATPHGDAGRFGPWITLDRFRFGSWATCLQCFQCLQSSQFIQST